MKSVLLILILLVTAVLAVGQAGYAQEPPAYYGLVPPPEVSTYRTPYVYDYLDNGVYIMEPFAPPGYVFSQPFMGFPVPADLGGYVTGPYATGNYVTGSYLNGSYIRGSYVSGSYATRSYLGRRY